MTRTRHLTTLLTLSSALTATGCSSMSGSGWNSLSDLFDTESQQREEEMHRSRFQESRSTADMHWLLQHHVENGMTPAEVSRVLGEQGQRVYDDGWIKNRGGHYHAGDDTWKWGPDRKGNSVYLVFRDHKLVHFEPNEFILSPFNR